MGLTLLTERHADQIAGVLSCYDRILVFGTLPGICFAEGMTSYLLHAEQYHRFRCPTERLQYPQASARMQQQQASEISEP